MVIERDILYDPKLDSKDAKWIKQMRRGRESDAILSCPCCFSTLCVDCQQHEVVPNRFRAMFVMNTKVDREAKRYPRVSKTQGKRKKNEIKDQAKGDACFAVYCDVCGVEVAVYDNEGVYHFFNVLPSNA